MNYPNLYIKSLLEEVKTQNEKMIQLNNEFTRQRFLNSHMDGYEKIHQDIDSISLYIEQLHQEVLETVKNIKD